jgi:hypothetical protein
MNTQDHSVLSSLRGKSIAIFGGEPREPARLRLEQELGCRVTHFASRENDASARRFAKFEHQVFDLVVWICGCSRTAHGEYVRDAARRRGIPFLVLRSFPHPNRLVQELANRHLLGALALVGGAR